MRWEEITESTSRLKVFGGWVVCRRREKGYRSGAGCSDALALGLVFVPDARHEWSLEEEI